MNEFADYVRDNSGPETVITMRILYRHTLCRYSLYNGGSLIHVLGRIIYLFKIMARPRSGRRDNLLIVM